MKDIFNTFNRVEIDLKEYDNTSLSNNEIEKIKNRVSQKLNKKKRFNYKGLVAAIGVSIVVISIFNNDIVSAHIGKFSDSFKEFFNISESKDYTDYTTAIGETVIDNNISVMLEEVIIDNNQLIISSIVDYSNVKDINNDRIFDGVEDYTVFQNINLNGKEYRDNHSIVSQIHENKAKYITFINIDNVVSNAFLNCIISYEFYPIDSEQSDAMNSYLGKKVEGSWDFRINMNSSNISDTVKKISISENNQLEFKNGDLLTINEVVRSDISIKVYYDLETYKDYYSTAPIKILDSNKNYLYPIYYNNSYAHFLIKDNLEKDTIIIRKNEDINPEKITINFKE